MNDNQVINQALAILSSRLRQPGEAITSPVTAINFLTLQLAELEHEVFAVLFLDNQHRMIELDIMFRGTINAASVYPREVAKKALQVNASAAILSHNHPSGNPQPSDADREITRRLSDALDLFDIRILDHIIIGGMDHFSFAERGLL